MPNLIPKNLYIGNTQTGNIYTITSNSGGFTIIKNINICNTGATSITSNIHIIPSGGTAVANNQIFSNAIILSGETVTYDTSIVLNANSSLYISSNAATASLVVSGVEYVV